MNNISPTSPTTTLNSKNPQKISPQTKWKYRSSSAELVSRIDPKEYQKTEEYPPDQLEIWDKFCPGHENDNFITWVNAGQEAEITKMKEAIGRIEESNLPLPSWACQSIKAWWIGHHCWVKDRYIIQRDFYIPRLAKRFHYPKEVQNAHDVYIGNLQTISHTIENLKPGDSLEKLHKEWTTYENNVISNNRLQELFIPILYHAYFSPKDVADIASRMSQMASSTYLGATIYFIGVEKLRRVVLPRKNLPPVAWNLNLKKHYDGYMENTVAHLDALSAESFIIKSKHETNIVERCRTKRRTLDKENPDVFNPFDPIYQLSKEHPPDKLFEWEEAFEDHIKSSPRYLANKAHLAESEEMKDILKKIQNRISKLLQTWEVSSIQKWFHAHRKWVTGVYNWYSTVVHSWLVSRIHYPTPLMDGQKKYLQLLAGISDIVECLKPGDTVNELMTKWIQYDQYINSFWAMYNKMHFMLVHAYFSREEQADFMRKTISRGMPWLGPIIYNVGKDVFRNTVMKREKVGDVHWHLEFGVYYIDYCENIAKHMEALKVGEAPHTLDKRQSKTVLPLLDSLWVDPSDLSEILQDD
mmetsp:Transcript_15936/g.22472  ORF Transcript_15936/g.22472 Transcript_15936/m.22472 type:complete len:583 (-) Transcript_15936:92-1840(-)